MMKLRRLLLDSIGESSARFSNTVLDFSDPSSTRTIDTIIWLRNGGGKTSLLALFFSLLLPRQHDFVGAKTSGRCLADYILTGDTAHVIAEWDTPNGPLVTGAVYQWPDRQRPVDHKNRQSDVAKAWYVFTPSPRLTVETLPRRIEGKRARFDEFVKELRALSRSTPSLQLQVLDKMVDWHTALGARGVDPAVFGYQKDMNRGEGTIDELFQFTNPMQFIDFVIDITTDPDDLDSHAQRLRKVADRLGRRRLLETERSYCDGVAERLSLLDTAWQERERERLAFEQARTQAAAFALSLSRASKHSEAQAAAASARHRDVAAELSTTRTARQDALLLVKEYELRGARFEQHDAQHLLSDLKTQLEDAKHELRAREALEHLIASDNARRSVADIDMLLIERTREAEPLRQQRNVAARRLVMRLAQLQQDQQQVIVDLEAGIAANREKLTTAKADAHHERECAGNERSRYQQAVDAIALFEADLDRARHDNLVGDDEAAAHAHERTVLQIDAVRRELERLEEVALRGNARLEALVPERNELSTTLAQQQSRVEQLTADVDDVVSRAELLVGDERLREMAGSDHFSVWTASELLDQRLGEEITHAERELINIGVLSAADRRKDRSLADGLLPTSEEAEAILTLLNDKGIRATSGFSYLATSVARGRWDDVLAMHPAIVSGVVVDAGDFEPACAITIEAALHPGALVAVATKETLDATGEMTTFVVPPSPALFDRESAAAERAAVIERLEAAHLRGIALESQRSSDYALRETLRRLLNDCPSGRLDEWRSQLEQSQNEVRIAGERITELDDERETITTELRTIAEGQRRHNNDLQKQSSIATRLEHLVAREVTIPGFAEQRDAAESAMRQHRERALEFDRVITACEDEVDQDRERVFEATQRQRALRDELSTIDFVGEDAPTDVELDAEIDTTALRTEFVLRHEIWQKKSTDAVLSERREHALRDLSQADKALGEYTPSAREFAKTLQSTSTDENERSRTRAAVAQRHEMLISEVARAGESVKAAEQRVRDLSPTEGNAHHALADDDVPADREEARTREAETRVVLEQLRLRENELTQSDEALRREEDQQRSRVTHLAVLVMALTQLIGNDAKRRDTDADTDTDTDAFEGTNDEATGRQEQYAFDLKDAQQQLEIAQAYVNERHHDLRRYATSSAFREIDDLTDATSADLGIVAPDSSRLADAHRERSKVITHELDSIAQDQEIIVTGLVGQVRRTLELLTKASRMSVMPDGLGEWTGKSFLTINFDDPASEQAELRRRVEVEVDAVVTNGDVPDGARLLKRVLRASVPGGFRVQILKPNAEWLAERVTIVSMSAWSGGEKLTAAVVLYCTLARLRSGSRMSADANGGMLILDNPLGKSSYVRFVGLQRRVAAVLGVQLIYTTGVKDLAAVGSFPNVIRCRNVRPPGRRHRYVDATDRAGDAHRTDLSAITNARIVRIDVDADVAANTAAADADADGLALFQPSAQQES